MKTRSSKHVWFILLAVVLSATTVHAERFYAVAGDGDVEAVETTGAKAWNYGEPNIVVSRNGLQFNVYIMDILYDRHEGFASDASNGPNACARLTEVLEYMADVLDEQGTIDLLVKESAPLASGFDVYGGTYFTSETSSQAGAVLYRLRTGEKQSPDLADMFLQVDFGGNFYYGTGKPGKLQLDFSSLLLHALTHSLGAVSLMTVSGASSAWPGIYTEWDWHLVEAQSGEYLIDGVPPNYASFVGDSDDLTEGDLAFDGPNTLRLHGSLPSIYTPHQFVKGGSICHWGEEMKDGAVLELITPKGTTRRHWAPEDLGALEDIGYTRINEACAGHDEYSDTDSDTDSDVDSGGTPGCASGVVMPGGGSGPFKSGLEFILAAGILAMLSLRRIPAKKRVALFVIAAMCTLGIPAFAELQNVVVGGSIQVRGNWFDYEGLNAIRIAPNTLAKNNSNSNAFAEQRTRLSIRADFTENVNAFIELDSYGRWGDGFRSNYLTGVDSRPVATNGASSLDAQVYQAYIEAKELWGTDLKLKVGRQELNLGGGWLVGTGSSAPYSYGRSFDAVRLTYAMEQFSVDAIMAKLQEGSPVEEDGDIDFYSVYGSYRGIENVVLDAYWMFVRDAAGASRNLDTHTFGVRGAGTIDAFDFSAEAAYQHADPDTADSIDTFAGTLEAGYTLDIDWTPRFFVGGAYFDSGEDGAFDRLFSDTRYSKILDGGVFAGTRLTGFWTVSAGASAAPIENLKLQLSAAYLQSAGNDSLDKEDLGWELDASATYNYSHDLVFQAGYSRLFASQDLSKNGSVVFSGMNTEKLAVLDDVNYFYLETKIAF